MSYWLVKSEPDSWSWDAQVKAGPKGTAWTGVRNHTAKQNLMDMKKGDRAFFYHSNVGKEIVGIAEIIREHYPDPTDKTEKFVCVDLKAKEALKKPVPLTTYAALPRRPSTRLRKLARTESPTSSAPERTAVAVATPSTTARFVRQNQARLRASRVEVRMTQLVR